MRKLIFLIGLLFVNISFGETFHFVEKSGGVQTIVYQALCLDNKGSTFCKLDTLSFSNSSSKLRKCTVVSSNLFDFTKAVRSGDSIVISVSAGACEYTNTYQFSNTGMIQIKSSPQKKKFDACAVFEPKTYKMKYYKHAGDIKVDYTGCKFVSPSFQ